MLYCYFCCNNSLLLDHCTTDGRADYYFLNVGDLVEAKLKPQKFQRNGNCRNEKAVAEVWFYFEFSGSAIESK